MKALLKLSVVLLLVAMTVAYWLWQDMNRYIKSPLVLSEPVSSFIVPKGSSFNQLLMKLEGEGIITKPLYFKVFATLEKLSHQVKAGEYRIDENMTPKSLLMLFVSGKSVQHYFTIIEGSTFAQVRQALEKHSDILAIELTDKSDREILEAIGAKELHPEGLFLAETYGAERGTSDLDILKRSYRAQQDLLRSLWEKRNKDLPYATPYEALVMASIVEKETAVPEERPVIAGVFVKRLNIGMKLQTDPTVIYGMGDKYQGNITRKDLRTPTPYNTYTIEGLPPTPIAMVGPEAIQAALNPEVGKWLYFVAKGDGTHQFSASLKDHNRAVRAYQLKRKQSYRSTPES